MFIYNSYKIGERTPEAMLKEEMKLSSGVQKIFSKLFFVITVTSMLTPNTFCEQK